MVVQEIRIAALERASIDRNRPRLDAARVAHYKQDLDAAPPVTVYDTGQMLLLADGHHRLEAARQLGRSSIKADVRRGSAAEALGFAVATAVAQRGLAEEQVRAAILRRSESPQ